MPRIPPHLMVERSLHSDLCATISRTSPTSWDVGAEMPHTLRLINGEQVVLLVVAATGVPLTKGVLTEINDQNLHASHVVTAWLKGEVHVRGTLPLRAMTDGALGTMIAGALEHARNIGSLIATVHGGTVARAA